MSRYIFNLIPLTPIHVGSGETLEAYEYVIVDHKLYQFDPNQILLKLTPKEQDEFVNLVATSPSGLQRFLHQKKNLVASFDPSPIPVADEALQKYGTQLNNPTANLTLYPFIKTSRKPFIPGSSLKGAIRTALLYGRAFLQRNNCPITELNARRLEQSAFKYQEPARDPFKRLKISDSQPLAGVTRLELVKVYTERQKEGQIPTFREVMQPELFSNSQQAFLISVQILENRSDYDSNSLKMEITSIVSACRQFYVEHMRREKRFFHSANFTDTSSQYEKLLEQVEDASSADRFPVRFGWGSGLDAVTVNYAIAKPRKPLSRRLAENGMPLGWAKIEVKGC